MDIRLLRKINGKIDGDPVRLFIVPKSTTSDSGLI